MTEHDSVSSTLSIPEAQSTILDKEKPSGRFVANFWGVRGSIPIPGVETLRYGGNTACLEVQVSGERLIFDGGTGLRALGETLMRQEEQVKAHIFFTHTHWDRIQGFPFFLPAFKAHNRFQIYGATALNGASIKHCLTDQMLLPNCLTPLQQMRADIEFHNISAGSVLQIGDILIETISLNPKTCALGFRITWTNHSLVYATDTDHTQESLAPNLQYLASQADVLILDGTYTDSEYYHHHAPEYVPWKVGVDVAKAAAVKELIMFHHNPFHTDETLDQLEKEIRSHFANARLAREGMTLKLA